MMRCIVIIVVKFLMMSKKVLIYVAGPTAVGKTTYSIKLAKELNTEIISCDSRQCYKEMQIGTAVPSIDELNEVSIILFNIKVFLNLMVLEILKEKHLYFYKNFLKQRTIS